MSDKRTLALNGRQWRVLIHDNLDIVKAFVQSNEALTEDGLRGLVVQLEDMKMLAAAWFQVSAPPAVEQSVAQAANGVEKKKPGWPKGKKRNAPMRVVQ